MEESPSDYNTWQHGHFQTYKSVSDPDKNTVSYYLYQSIRNLPISSNLRYHTPTISLLGINKSLMHPLQVDQIISIFIKRSDWTKVTRLTLVESFMWYLAQWVTIKQQHHTCVAAFLSPHQSLTESCCNCHNR